MVFLSSALSAAPSAGNLRGLILDEQGEPLSNVVISLLSVARVGTFPTVSRTDSQGRLFLQGLEAGTYQVQVNSSKYRSPIMRLVEILPNRTAAITVILQQVLALGEDGQENVGIKALFRNVSNERLIFRNNEMAVGVALPEERPRRFFEDAVFEVYTNAGVGSSYFVYPGDSWAGTTTNFAAVDSLTASADYIVAGQLNSGENSVWRIKNLVDYQLGNSQSLSVFFGYGRMSYEQPSLALMSDPREMTEHGDFATTLSSSKLLNMGFEDRVRFGRLMTLTWGLDLDQFSGEETRTFLSPTARLEIQPTDSTAVSLAMVSKRPSLGNSLTLPNGSQVSMATPLFISRVDNEVQMGTGRFYEGSITQLMGAASEFEFALFENQLAAGANPIVAILGGADPRTDVYTLDGSESNTRGFRLTLRRRFSEKFSAEASYIRGRGPGLGEIANVEVLDAEHFGSIIERQDFHAVATQVSAYLSSTGTHLTALVRFVPEGDPLMTLDLVSDVYETGNQGVNFFVRQMIPLPASLLSFLGLDFLTPQRIEALLDVRNLMNERVGVVQSPAGDIALVQNPRSVRGGIAFRF